MEKLPYLNLGCGTRFHTAWVNVDMVSSSPHVLARDLTKGIPFPANTFEVVYHSHVLEHIPPAIAPVFIADCYRVLKPGGVLRVAVPDLEQITREYLRLLDQNLANETPKTAENYDYVLLELLDQLARNQSGGLLAEFIAKEDVKDLDFVYKRGGEEARHLREHQAAQKGTSKVGILMEKVKKGEFRSIKNEFKKRIWSKMFGKNYEIGSFRQSGETHQWMYDQYSLPRLLTSQGFEAARKTGAFDSQIANWPSFELDGKDGMIFKPDSLFVEAKKPMK